MNVDMFKKKSKEPDSNALEVVWAAIDMLNMEIRALKHGVVPKKKVKKEGWVNVCLDHDGKTRWCVGPYDTKPEADKREYEMASVRLDCIHIEWEEE